MTLLPGPCLPGRPHSFDSSSGWCLRGCGWRSDGAASHPANQADAIELVDVTEPRHQSERGLFA